MMKHICWDLNFTNYTNFQSLEVVDRCRETQLQVTENLNFLAQCSKGSIILQTEFFQNSPPSKDMD